MTQGARLFAPDGAILRRHRDVLPNGARRAATRLGALILVIGTVAFAVWWLDLGADQLGTGLRQLGKFVALMFPPATGGHLMLFLHAMGETLAIAFLGTLVAATLAFPVSFLAAENTAPSSIVRFLVRRGFDTIRGVDVLIWALVFVGVVGLGPFAGILAIAVSDSGAFGKLFSEAIEEADRKPLEGVLAAGGSKVVAVRFALIPQVLPVLVSQVLYFFESNVRSATIIGIVGAGGIGLQLSEQIRTYDFDQMSFVIIMILVTVAAIDWMSARLRHAVIGPASG